MVFCYYKLNSFFEYSHDFFKGLEQHYAQGKILISDGRYKEAIQELLSPYMEIRISIYAFFYKSLLNIYKVL